MTSARRDFLFQYYEEYTNRSSELKNQYGAAVEEFVIQFIDGELIDCDLAEAWGINQANIARFIAVANEWDDEDKSRFILAIGESGYEFDPEKVTADAFEVDVYHVDSMRDLAIDFVDQGLYGDVPERFQSYIDYDAIAHDLAYDYNEAVVAGEYLIYRCA